ELIKFPFVSVIVSAGHPSQGKYSCVPSFRNATALPLPVPSREQKCARVTKDPSWESEAHHSTEVFPPPGKVRMDGVRPIILPKSSVTILPGSRKGVSNCQRPLSSLCQW